MESTMFWQIVAIVTYALILSTVLSVLVAGYIFKMYPKLVADMMAEMAEDDDTSLDDHFRDTPDPKFFPPSLSRE